ncbi:hypothetical protein B4589_004530 [Halolamina sp. CBA1230]|uniref:DUF7680 family protein n=1 Tax=Halolamina sp. CBA1230 TaxID=1853690 RepID=UPI0009A16B42|nr:hypothetical protein [Halolamina sp. CBA1230]QKY19679.1 hypothetical protein B4589_004530 [Halolamina sp. CBA1230]
MSKGLAEGNSFAFTTGAYGNRPTFVLTRERIDDQHEVSLYELAPEDIATARKERFDKAQKSENVTTYDLNDAIVGDQSPSELPGTDNSGPFTWDSWCAIKIATLRGDSFNEVSFLIESTFKEIDLDPQIICTGAPASVSLPEGTGVRLSIAFRTMKPIRRRDKLRAVAKGIDQMSLGECYYWHAKARSPSSPNGTKALRVLLADHL